jgi:hypothetical protein
MVAWTFNPIGRPEGAIIGAPAACTVSDSTGTLIMVCGRGFDSHYFLIILDPNGTIKTDWTSDWAGAGQFQSKPALVQSESLSGATVINAFGLGLEGAVWRNAFAGNQWSGWIQVPDLWGATSAPAVSSDRRGNFAVINLCVRGANGNIFRNDFDGSTWGGWNDTELSLGAGVSEVLCKRFL